MPGGLMGFHLQMHPWDFYIYIYIPIRIPNLHSIEMNMRAGSAAAYKDLSGEITTEKIAPIMLHAVRPHCFREPRYIVQAP
jgi:hypothetical protein